MLIRARGSRMSDMELSGAIQSRLAITGAVTQAQAVANDRAKALRYYRGEPLGIEQAGRSQVVSRDVQETVDGLMPSLIKVFASGPPVEFRARSHQFEKAAEEATASCQYVWSVQNPGFTIYNTWFKDALLQKLGTVKSWWDKTEQSSTQRFEHLTEPDFQRLQNYPDAKVTWAESYEVDGTPGMRFYNAEVRIIRSPGRVCIDPIPPENFLFDYWARDLKSSRVLGDMWEYTVTELIDQGYDRDLIDQIPTGGLSEFNLERLARVDQRHSLGFGSGEDSDPASQRKWVYELYMPLDYDGDGYAEMRRIVCAGPQANVILENEEASGHPYSCITPTIMPHRIEGMSIADQTMDLQEIKTVGVRGLLDGMYLAINPMWEVVEGQVNIDDMLLARPGSIKRTKAPGMIRSLSAAFDPTGPMAMIGYMDKVRELRTGLPQSPGQLSDDVMAQDGGATGANIINDARMERVELIARTFAEGVKDAFRHIVGLLKAYQTKPMPMQMGGAWRDISPSQWPDEFDMEIKVGLGSGRKDQMLMHLGVIKQTQEAILMQLGPDNPLVGLAEYHNTLQDTVKNAGLGDSSRYFKDPARAPDWRPAPKQDPAMMKAQADMAASNMQMRLEVQKHQQTMRLEQQKADNAMQIEKFKAAMKVEIDRENAIAQAAITVNQELARSGMFGGAAADGIPPDAPMPQAGAFEQGLDEGVSALEKELAAALTSPPIEEVQATSGTETGGEPAAPPAPDQSQQMMATIAEMMRGNHEGMAATQSQIADALKSLSVALSRPRTVRRGKDGKIEGVE